MYIMQMKPPTAHKTGEPPSHAMTTNVMKSVLSHSNSEQFLSMPPLVHSVDIHIFCIQIYTSSTLFFPRTRSMSKRSVSTSTHGAHMHARMHTHTHTHRHKMMDTHRQSHLDTQIERALE